VFGLPAVLPVRLCALAPLAVGTYAPALVAVGYWCRATVRWMSKRLVVTMVDDIDGTSAVSSHTVGLDDRRVRIDLSAANLVRLRALLAPHLGLAPSASRRGRAVGDPSEAAATSVHRLELDGRRVQVALQGPDVARLRVGLAPFLDAGRPASVPVRHERSAVSLADMARAYGIPIRGRALPRELLEAWRAQLIGSPDPRG